MKTIYETEIAGLPIKLERTRSGKEFTVTYWKQVRKGLNYEHAAEELGYCIMHALACDGRLDPNA